VSDFFEIFGLERRLAIDGAALQRRFYELSRQWHPDFHGSASADVQARALDESARVNAAYRALRDPLRRVEYLISLEEGRATGGDGGARPGFPSNKDGAAVKPKAPPALLAEMFEIQEALEEAKGGPLDGAARATLIEQREGLEARMAETEARVVGPLSQAWDAAAPAERAAALNALKEALATRAYLRTVVDDLAAALEGREQEVRH
jgi:molecular chaperone HscB